MTNITFKVREEETVFAMDLPAKFYLRHDIEGGYLLHATLDSAEFNNDPKDMYKYSIFDTKVNPAIAFYLHKRFIDSETDDYETEFETFVDNFNIKVDPESLTLTAVEALKPVATVNSTIESLIEAIRNNPQLAETLAAAIKA